VTRTAKRQQGMALIEALIASAVLGIGLVGATQLTLKTLNTARESRQHTVAQHLAQEAMDCLRAQIQTGTSFCPAQESLQEQGVLYRRETLSTPRGDGMLHDLQVRVLWAAMGRPMDTGGGSGTTSENRIEWHSSASPLTGWVGVSSP
jgi:type IV pilus modification protein PilV